MQPYWIPYPGYFRLFARCDVFIILDDVQFPRRGYVHRNKIATHNGELDWLTLPLQKAHRSARISEILFHEDADDILAASIRRFPALENGFGVIETEMERLNGSILPLITGTLRAYKELLGFDVQFVFSSDIETEAETAQGRIIELVKKVGGREYVNLSGGTGLYDPSAFEAEGIELSFLSPWSGDFSSILQQTTSEEGRIRVREQILRQSRS